MYRSSGLTGSTAAARVALQSIVRDRSYMHQGKKTMLRQWRVANQNNCPDGLDAHLLVYANG
jgi:hypothetical protein